MPTDVYTDFLQQQDKIVQGLIKHQLITVKRVSANGDGSPPKPDENPEDATSHMELTEKGRAYYTDGEARIGSKLLYTAKFCAPGLQVGKILDYSKPGKNPFDDNPNAVFGGEVRMAARSRHRGLGGGPRLLSPYHRLSLKVRAGRVANPAHHAGTEKRRVGAGRQALYDPLVSMPAPARRRRPKA
ncbi:hypothetical protein ACFZAI_26530 [Achromobacter sp. NPDC008082]|uniref:hypothetical protein n=1 Tax=Achromobacter sp. NPDC008082 TaxID=3363888 RepID=UPI0036EC082A